MADREIAGQAQLDFFAEDQAVAAVPLQSRDEAERRRELQRISPADRIQGILNVHQLREQLEAGDAIAFRPSRPCRWCGSANARLRQSGNQLPVTCADCGRVSYNAPRAEVGLTPRTVKTLRSSVSASQQARILDRDHGRCVFCGSSGDLNIGHLLSVADAARLGATADEINDDANLAAMCETCNIGLGQRSVSLLTATILHHLLQAERLHRQPARTTSSSSGAPGA